MFLLEFLFKSVYRIVTGKQSLAIVRSATVLLATSYLSHAWVISFECIQSVLHHVSEGRVVSVATAIEKTITSTSIQTQNAIK